MSARRARWLPLGLLIAALAVWATAAASHRPAESRLATSPPVADDPPGSVVRVGSLLLPRAGPTVVGFLSPGAGRLIVDGHELRGAGVVRSRLIWPTAGPVSVRFAAPPGARLLWNPVGRRGALEYVPESSLSPAPPDRARFSPWAGAFPRQAALATLGLGLALAALGAALRPRLAAVSRRRWAELGGVAVVALLVRLWGLGAAGQTWDEDMYWTAGRNLVQNVLALDLHATWWRWNAEHPPVTKLWLGLGALWMDGFGAARVLSAVASALSCALLVPIGARLGARGAGLWAGLVAALSPHLIAHGQVAGHETPSLLFWALGMWLALDLHRPDEQGPLSKRVLVRRLAVLGVVVGLSASTRFIGALLGPAALVAAVAAAPDGQRLRVLRAALAVVPVVALAICFALWPWLWPAPIAQLEGSWRVLRAAVMPEPYLGELTAYPPRSYFVRYLVATAPVGVSIAAVTWVALVVARLVPRRSTRAPAAVAERAPQRRRELVAGLVVLAWLVMPLVVSLSPVRKDGVRYVIPTVLGLALAAGLGVAALAARWPRRGPFLVGPALLAYLAVVVVRARPYYLDYYGELAGGAAEVSRQRTFETAWWGEGLDRAVAYINRHAAPHARISRACIAPTHLTWFRGDLWQPMVAELRDAQWIIAYAPRSYPCPVPADARRVFTVEHRGLVLAEVYQRP